MFARGYNRRLGKYSHEFLNGYLVRLWSLGKGGKERARGDKVTARVKFSWPWEKD